MREIAKKLQLKFILIAIICIGYSVHAEPCLECDQLQGELTKEIKLRESYLTLKGKNEYYLKRPDVPSGAAIKVRSNLMLLGIKIETQDNKIEAITIQKKKFNHCPHCT